MNSSTLFGSPDAAGAPRDLACRGCNVIFLNIELLRADFTGLISNADLTPNIDAFFEHGVVFEDASAPAGETFLSNTSVLTLTLPHQIPVMPAEIDRYKKLDLIKQLKIEKSLTSSVSMAQVLSQHGYHTININQGGRAGQHVFLDRGFADYSQWSSKILMEDLVDLLIDKLERPSDHPRFVLFRPTLLHNHQYRHPIQPDTEYASSINARRYEYQAPNGTNRYAYFLKRQRDLEPERAQQIERHIYSRQLSYADAQLGRVFKVLQERYNDNSIVVLYANHGTGLGDNGIFKHGVAYQSCVHVPILILHPKISITVRVPSAVALADLAPAIYKMLEIPWATPISNDHLFDVLSGRNTEEKVLIGKNNWDEYIRIGPWKLIVRYGRFKLLFNIKSDPHESIDLYLKEPIIANRLEATLLNHKIKYARH